MSIRVLNARTTTLFVPYSYPYLLLLILLSSLRGHYPSLRAWATSAWVPSTIGAPSSSYPPIKMDLKSAFRLSRSITSPKMAKPTTNNTLTTL